tara:strand:+ start:251 stop:496 length:246 start_codon:yes stop_codon:yes gene_type:complete
MKTEQYYINEGFEWVALKDLPKGTFFKRSETTDKVYIKDSYARGEDYLGRKLNKYECIDFDDTNHIIMIKGNKEVFINFEF